MMWWWWWLWWWWWWWSWWWSWWWWWWWWWWWSDDSENGDGDYLYWHCMLAAALFQGSLLWCFQGKKVHKIHKWHVWHEFGIVWPWPLQEFFRKLKRDFVCASGLSVSGNPKCFTTSFCGNQASLSQSGNMSQYDQCEIVWISVNNSRENECLQFPASGRTDFSNMKNPQTQSWRVFNQIVYEYSMQPISTFKRSQKDWMRGWQVVAFFSFANTLWWTNIAMENGHL